MKIVRAILLNAALLFACSGCVGTIFTRNKDFVGKYPYEGVALSAKFMVAEVAMEPKMAVATIPLFSFIVIPLDFVCDTLLLPADLACWLFGMERSGPIDWR